MKVTLDDDEVRSILVQALQSKTIYSGMSGSFESDDCYFSVTSAIGAVEDLESISFTADIEGIIEIQEEE